ncbi:MAG TPA: hypothetical protein VLR49_05395 [Ferruginibacter sp.]|nr:hypothetical protein [Ferruginibacter sp.]
MKKKLFSCLGIYMLVSFTSFAQTEGYQYKANIEAVNETGFYNIVLTPEIKAHLKTNYSDLRIINSDNKWVPHLLRWPNLERTKASVLLDLLIIKKESNNVFTEMVVKSTLSKVSNLQIKLSNTDAERFGTLTGSDDNINWFIINDSIQIKPAKSGENNISTFMIEFPPSNYDFYKIYIHNKERAPYNILAISTSSGADPVTAEQGLAESLENPAAIITQKDSGRYSYIRVVQPSTFHFDKIGLKISAAKYFYRKVDLYIPISNDHSFNNPGRLQQSFSISNNSTLQYKIPLNNSKLFYLIIHNEDNLPVKVDDVKTYSNLTVATAYLEKANKYSLILDNVDAVLPNYDLQQLPLNLQHPLPVLGISQITAVKQSNMDSSTGINKKWMLWLAIIAAALTLGFFTYKLVSEMNKK